MRSLMPLNPPSDFPGVLSVEVDDIGGRREALFPRQKPLDAAPAPTPPHPFIEAHRIRPFGVAFSGGGIRSATFNLGVLQGLAELGLLPFVDYLSTVSGGGYIGSWLHGVIRNKYLGDPAAAQPELDPGRVPGEAADDPITFLRKYSNYLAPQLGLFSPDFWTIGAVWIRNMLLNLLILIPFLVGVVLTVLMSGILQQKFGQDLAAGIALTLWAVALVVAVAVMGVNLRQIVFTQFPGLKPRFKVPDLSGRGIVGFATLCILFASYILGANHFDPHPAVSGAILAVLYFLLQWVGGFRLCYRARHGGASGWPWLIAIPLVCAAFTSALLWSVWKLTGTWVDPDVGWQRIALGPAMILMVWMCGATLQIGLMGRTFPMPRASGWTASARPSPSRLLPGSDSSCLPFSGPTGWPSSPRDGGPRQSGLRRLGPDLPHLGKQSGDSRRVDGGRQRIQSPVPGVFRGSLDAPGFLKAHASSTGHSWHSGWLSRQMVLPCARSSRWAGISQCAALGSSGARSSCTERYTAP